MKELQTIASNIQVQNMTYKKNRNWNCYYEICFYSYNHIYE